MSFVYLGTSSFAAAVLERLVGAGHRPKLVISRPDAPKGRGRVLGPPPVAEKAIELDLALLQPEEIGANEVLAELDSIDPEALVLCAYGAIIREPLLTRWPILNLHPSLLPRWRGAAPIERAIMAGDESTGVSIIRLVEELDAGPIALSSSVEIGERTFGELAKELEQLGASMLIESLDRLAKGELRFDEQSSEGITYAERITAEDRDLDSRMTASELSRVVRALNPHIGARLRLEDGEMIGVREAEVVADGPQPSEIGSDERGLLLGCAEGALLITRVVPAGSREMPAIDWLRGRRVDR